MTTDNRNKWMGRLLASLAVIIFGLTTYVNWYMPHGPMIDTGDVVCRNDDRGPCSEAYIEDTRNLDIPEWAKFLRTSENELLIFGLAFAAVYVSHRTSRDSACR